MREILFRGKRTYNGEWVEGKDIMHETVRGKLCLSNVGEDWVSVEPETVGQYTGLTDKNGKKIFEGDIVKLIFKEKTDYYGEVLFHNGGFCIHILNFFVCLQETDVYEFKYIGNKWDNPELLEEQK